MTETADACCDWAYLCNGEVECTIHGGFDVCCDRLDLHQPVTAVQTVTATATQTVTQMATTTVTASATAGGTP